MRRILLILAVIAVGSVAVVTAATAAGRGADAVNPAPILAPKAIVSYQPAAGSTDVNPTAPISATVTDGAFDQVALVNPDGAAVRGTLSPERTVWTSAEPLGYGKTYTWRGTATGTDGRQVPVDARFATLNPARQVRGALNIGDGRTVGIAAPIEIQFHSHVSDRAAVERALSVTSSVPTEGAWGWLPDENGGSRVHWRPKEYWKPGTKVTVTAKLYGVAYGDGRYGVADLSSTFTIGRAQIVKADVNSHRMTVIRDGREVADYPASYGLASDPDRNTRSGIHVVSEKFTDKRMVSERYGYDVMEKWAVRISNNGEFIHANPASADAQGSSNVTHGCVNLSTEDAKAYYDTALYGDPVEVTGTPVQLSARDGDIWDWTLSWQQWRQLSAL
ncbi:L,D-transpeptidase [Pseudonocardia asaccharolytica]|uniref:L,D-transpeptidase n=1 Tax=Pseudonocardia asaccharolytica DSM 44247 = NBRC 16224 TaxID=1123024 RepID=A0A511CZW0_9PSEU|nr:Ig-like domain-containing protein [Pseudonocardia asaccharolytica]GEL17987.1 L,D-transpeptidase [Pseudonocardia asaccharolytica DSM 44247 = NBRC 16224]